MTHKVTSSSKTILEQLRHLPTDTELLNVLVEYDPTAPRYRRQGRPARDGRRRSRSRSPAAHRKTQSAQAPPLNGINHAITTATRTTRTGNALVQLQKLPATLAQQALQLRTLSSLRNSRPSWWHGIGAPNNRPRKVLATISNESNENTNQPILVTNDNPSIVSSSVNKVCVALGYTGLAPSIVNERGIINISSVSQSPAEKSLLAKGLSFCPNTNYVDMGDAMRALDKFHHDLCLKYFFGNAEETDTEIAPPRAGFEHKTSAALPVGNHPVDRPPENTS